MRSESDAPVHESLNIIEIKNIYKNKNWWKAVVRYRFNEGDKYDETAVYLWHYDDGWNRKNKYVIKTREAWQTDKIIINRLFSDEDVPHPDRELPVSDYYTIGAGETVFRSDEWWKSIVKIVQKGSYETEEIMVYLWQQTDEEWRRRQKYTIKNEEDWHQEATAVEKILNVDSTGDSTTETTDSHEEESGGSVSEFDQLNREIDKHLSKIQSE